MLLYKYRDISGGGFQNTQDIFINRRLYLCRLNLLNDPNEAIAEIQIENQLRAWGNQLEERNRKNAIKVCSLSETNRSSLMWAHYAASHTGICIAFDFSKWKDTDSVKLKKVNYVDRPIQVKHSDMLKYGEIASHKEASWSYEKEWRFISTTKDFLPIDSDMIKMIFLGAHINPSARRWVQFWRDTFNPDLEIRQMHFVTCSYELYDETEIKNKVLRL